MDKKRIARVKQYIQEMRKIIPIEAAYLFGSFVHGSGMDSDIDLAVFTVSLDSGNLISLTGGFLKKAAELHLNVEPHLFHPDEYDDEFVRNEILTPGIKVA